VWGPLLGLVPGLVPGLVVPQLVPWLALGLAPGLALGPAVVLAPRLALALGQVPSLALALTDNLKAAAAPVLQEPSPAPGICCLPAHQRGARHAAPHTIARLPILVAARLRLSQLSSQAACRCP